MSRTLLPLAGFEVTFNGRFWVTTEGLVTLPGKPGDDLAPGTLNSIFKQAGLKKE